MADKAFLVDMTRCIGCRACQVACKQWNNLPAEDTVFFGGQEYTNPKSLSAITYNHVVFSGLDRSNPAKPVWNVMHKKCYHCEEPNCIAVCPQNGISKVDGFVVIDQSKCIGCGACEEACIYGVPHVSGRDFKEYGTGRSISKDKSYKCHGCITNKRDVPACASTCPTGGLTFGERNTLLQMAEKRLKEIKGEYPKANIYGKDQFGGLHVITILKDKPAKYGLEENPKPVDASRINKAKELYSLLSLATFGLPSLKRAAYKISRSIT
jgi:formate dehydrogenase iron-sulfur subunit